jgi:signal transduction histidine kinase
LQLIVDSALDLISNAEKAVIHIVDADDNSLHPMAIAGYTGRNIESYPVKMQMGKGIAGQVIRDGTTISISNVEDDPRFLRSHGEPAFRSLMVAPIQSGRQQIGTISVQSNSASAFSKKSEQLLNALAIDAAIAIENTRSFEETEQRLKEVNSLYGIIKVLAASLDPQELVNIVVSLLQKNFGFYFVQFYLVDPASGDLVFKAGSGEVGERLLQEHFRLSRGSGITGHVAETGVPFITKNVNDVVFFQRNPLLPDTLFELTVPIKIGQDVVGVLDIQDKPPKQFTQSDLQLVQAVGDQLAVALHKANLYTDLQNAMKLEQDIRSQLIQSERLALVGRLLASVSHELNNPLQAIQNALFLLKEESGLSMQGRQDLGIVLSETERMAALIERLRSAYRPIRGKDFQPVQINSLIEDVYALIGTHMRHKDIAFEFMPDPDLQLVSGISDQLRQVVLNLFLNAVEVMKPGGRLTVQTQNLIEQNEILFSVKDTGPGIEPEILPRIFDAFITSKHTGTGLGLTITHDILQQHHGRIIADNDPQGGAIFTVWLPTFEKEQE